MIAELMRRLALAERKLEQLFARVHLLESRVKTLEDNIRRLSGQA